MSRPVNRDESPRRSGVLAHVTSIPGSLGFGDFGPGTLRFLDWMAEAGQGLWQLLPLGPTLNHHSPYTALSARAANPMLVAIEPLIREGWVKKGEAQPAGSDASLTSFRSAKLALLESAWKRFSKRPAREREAFESYLKAGKKNWVHEWGLFATLRESFNDQPWTAWPEELRDRHPKALTQAVRDHTHRYRFHVFVQFQLERQWETIRQAAHARQIQIVGDIPFYPAHDSVDVWRAPHLFRLDPSGSPTHVAGVPPDYFSETGQLWGNPVYRWEAHQAESFCWWTDRMAGQFAWCDLLRLDHFRALSAYWEVPAGAASAVDGQWVPSPGEAILEAARAELGDLPMIAEDLGDIDDAVDKLRVDQQLPGMKILQFAYGSEESSERHRTADAHSVMYTGTHDNDTLRGWLSTLDGDTLERIRNDLYSNQPPQTWRLIEYVLASASERVLIPLQDLLELPSDARMNVPGVAEGNWEWRLRQGELSLQLAARLRRATERYDRLVRS